MRPRPLLLILAICLAVLVVVGVPLLTLLRSQPDFYRRGAMPAGDLRKQRSKEFIGQFVHLLNDPREYRVWGARLTDSQINSYFEEDFLRPGDFGRSFFPEVSAPRVAFENERIRFGMRYGKGWWSTILSVDLRVYLAAHEANVVVVEIERIRAGALPISAQSILERISEVARRQDIEVTWYRRQGRPVALFRFGAGRSDSGVQLQRLEMKDGTLTISGGDRSKPVTDGGSITAADLVPAAN
jgi:hypothetical protein